MRGCFAEWAFAGLSDVGLQRTTNQDSYYLSPDGNVFIVADGMGGHRGGQEASRLATEVMCGYLDEHWKSDRASKVLLEGAVLAANEAIVQAQHHHVDMADMGTTVVALIYRENYFWCAHVGDSRLYILRESGFIQATQDHTWVSLAVKRGDILPEQEQAHPLRHVLSKCVGRDDLRSVEAQQLYVQPGDRLLLCSDGLTDELSSDAIIVCMQSANTCEEAVLALIEAAKAQGGRDNITAIALAVSASFPWQGTGTLH